MISKFFKYFAFSLLSGALVHVSMNEASPWTPGYNVVGDKLQRNIFTNKVDQKSVTTACGNNLGKYIF